MASSTTKLDPTAPSFPHVQPPTILQNNVRPTPPLEDSLTQVGHETATATIDTTKLPDWMLVEEDERLRVAALSLSKLSTRDEWILKLRQFADLLAPGFDTAPPSDTTERQAWVPLAVRQMPPRLQPDLTTHGVTFSCEFIHNELHGIEWSPGLYYIPPNDRREGRDLTAYWVLDAALDPYLPQEPGEHGAKLTPFFNSTLSEPGMAPTEQDYMNTPVFISKDCKFEYRYFGHYSQTRFSDTLDYERMVDGTVPPFVLEMWAKYLTQPGHQPWVKEELRQHIWPKPTYNGPLPLNSPSASLCSDGSPSPAAENALKANDRRVNRAIKRYSERLQEWEIDTKLRLSLLTEADIHRLFRTADSDEQAGLRLWFEYLQCTSYKNSFYDHLVELKYNERLQHGYAEKMRELARQGWREQLVEQTCGNGHTMMVNELRPPPTKMSAARRDSVLDLERGRSSFRAIEQENGEIRASTSSKTQHAAEPEQHTPPAAHERPPTTSQQKSIPPHLRGRMAKRASKPADGNATTKAATTTTTETSQPTPFPTGDLEEAKRMNSTFTKAKPRPARGANFPPAPSKAEQALDRSDPMNQGWARAGRNPKTVPMGGPSDALW